MDQFTFLFFFIFSHVFVRILSKTDFLGLYLKLLCIRYGIKTKEYVIIAGYCLRNYGRPEVTFSRVAGDIDVIMGDRAFNILKNACIGEHKIKGVENLFIKLNHDLEIEIYKREDSGFPSNDFSVINLHKKEMIDFDKYSNPILNETSLIHYYSDVKKIDGKYHVGDQIFLEGKIKKIIGHLELISNKTYRTDVRELARTKLVFLTELISGQNE
jgi:hypothetical protein